jgi:type II secretory pathway component GspD/PulD (secretin)
MTLFKYIALIFCISISAAAQDKTAFKISFLNLKNCDIQTAASTLSLITKIKIVCTEKTSQKNVTLLIRDIDALDALKLICKSTNLVYRFDKNNDFYTLMTLEEYRENAVVDGHEETKIFKVEPANLRLIAETIEALYYQQVELTQSTEIVDFSKSNKSKTSENSNNNNNSNNNSYNNNNNNNNSNSGKSSNRNIDNNSPEKAAINQLSNEGALALEDASQQKKGSIFDLFSTTFGGPRIFVTTNREHNMLIIKTADIAALDEIEKLIQQIDEPLPQVILEMKILSLDIGEDERIGFDYSFSDGPAYFTPSGYDSDGVTTGLNFTGVRDELSIGQNLLEPGNSLAYKFVNENIAARLQMKAKENKADVIATPILIAANNREAKIEVGKERIITTGASISTDSSVENGSVGTITTISYDTEVRTIGTTLTIIPRINKDRTVTLYVEQENSTIVPDGNTLLVDSIAVKVDAVDIAKIQATVVAKDRYTIAIGGLIQSERSEQTDKVPLLGDLPLLGKLFSKKVEKVVKSELILLIRPFIIDGSTRADNTTKEIIQRLSSHHYHSEGDASIDNDNQRLKSYLEDLATQ